MINDGDDLALVFDDFRVVDERNCYFSTELEWRVIDHPERMFSLKERPCRSNQ